MRKDKTPDALREALTDLAQRPCPLARGKTYAEALAAALYRRALRGDVAAMLEIFRRVDGEVPQPHEVTGPGGAGIPVAFARRQRTCRETAKKTA